jgi:hypothetical protein
LSFHQYHCHTGKGLLQVSNCHVLPILLVGLHLHLVWWKQVASWLGQQLALMGLISKSQDELN